MLKPSHYNLLSTVKEELEAVMVLVYWYPKQYLILTNYGVKPDEIARWLTLTARSVRGTRWRKPLAP